MKRVCITGGAGFIGSNLADALSDLDVEVVVIDDFRTGRRGFLERLLAKPTNLLIESDVMDEDALIRGMNGCDWVFHFQANVDVRRGLEHPTLDLAQNANTTSVVLEAMRSAGVSNIAFASTGSVYGEPVVFPTPEDAPFPVQTSLYGASKLAAEGLIEAYGTGFGFTGLIFRFVSIMGERYTHGHVYDFWNALKRDPSRLTVLGDGRQEKSYLYVKDCVSAILTAAAKHEGDPGSHIYNLGTDETLIVDDSIALITDYLGVNPVVEHAGGRRGWIGDSPLILLDTSKIRSLGWAPRCDIRESVLRTLRWLDANADAWPGGTDAAGS